MPPEAKSRKGGVGVLQLPGRIEQGIEPLGRDQGGNDRIGDGGLPEGLTAVPGGRREALDEPIRGPSIHSCLDQRQQYRLRIDETARQLKVAAHPLGVDNQTVEDVGHLVEHVVQHNASVGEDHPFRRAVANVTFMPQRHVLCGNRGVAPEQARQTRDSLRGMGVTLVRHRRRPLVPRVERLFSFAHLGALQVADLDRHLLQRAADACQHPNEERVPVTLQHLRRRRRRRQTKLAADLLLKVRRDVGVGPDGPGELADGHIKAGQVQPAPLAAELVVPDRQFEAERGRLGVDPVGPPDRQRLLVCDRLASHHVNQPRQFGVDDLSSGRHLQRQGGVDHIRAGQTKVEETSGVAHRFAGRLEKGDDVVVSFTLDLVHSARVASRRPDRPDRPVGHPTSPVPRFRHRDLNSQPVPNLGLAAPQPSHLRSGITFDHLSPSGVKPKNVRTRCGEV